MVVLKFSPPKIFPTQKSPPLPEMPRVHFSNGHVCVCYVRCTSPRFFFFALGRGTINVCPFDGICRVPVS